MSDENGVKKLSQGIEVGWKVLCIIGAVVVWLMTLELRLARGEWEREQAARSEASLRMQIEAERVRNDAQDQAMNRFAVDVGVMTQKLDTVLKR